MSHGSFVTISHILRVAKPSVLPDYCTIKPKANLGFALISITTPPTTIHHNQIIKVIFKTRNKIDKRCSLYISKEDDVH